jgi:hypothetical protein
LLRQRSQRLPCLERPVRFACRHQHRLRHRLQQLAAPQQLLQPKAAP